MTEEAYDSPPQNENESRELAMKILGLFDGKPIEIVLSSLLFSTISVMMSYKDAQARQVATGVFISRLGEFVSSADRPRGDNEVVQ